MNIHKAEVHNFGSYSHLEFDYSSLGLSLVYGITGSGKSTLQDIPCWILFGITAKDGSVDDVRSWNNPDEATTGTLEVDNIIVTRVRGKSHENDLYWTEKEASPEVQKRGKDIKETQKLLEERLAVSAELYLSGAYFSEFSTTGSFFTAKAKDRRTIFEKIAKLDFVTKLVEGINDVKKTTKKDLTSYQTSFDRGIGELRALHSERTRCEHASREWDRRSKESIQNLEKKYETFEDEKANKINDLHRQAYEFDHEKDLTVKNAQETIESLLSDIKPDEYFHSKLTCQVCGSPDKKATEERIKNNRLIDKVAALKASIKSETSKLNPFLIKFEQVNASENHYKAQLEQERSKVNPFISQIEEISQNIDSLEAEQHKAKNQLDNLNHRLASLTQLQDLSFDLRNELLRKSVLEIETETNKYLETYFDAEFRVKFTLEDADKLEIEIQKNGHNCVYKQLSKGQRGLLKLTFSVSVMKAVANNAGVHFSSLLFDEALDGLDSNLKTKAFNLFQELEKDHESIILIDHTPEFQNLFDRKFHVTLEEDESYITEE